MSDALLRRSLERAWIKAAVALLTATFAHLGWSMDYREATIKGQPNVQYVVVAAPINSAALRVMIPSKAPTFTQNAAGANSSSSQQRYSYYQQGGALVSIEAASATPYVSSLPPGPVAVISGGFSGSDPSRPSALVIANGELNKQLNLTKAVPRVTPQDVSCPSNKKYKWSGVLCSTGRTLKISSIDDLEANGFADVEACRDALQSFPLIVEPNGKNGICSDEPRRVYASGIPATPQRRSLVCLTATEVKLIVTGPIHLYTLAEHLIAVEGCLTALNLSGSVQAGLGYRASPQTGWVWWPQTDEPRPPLASVIVVSESAASPVAPVRKK